MTDKSSFGERFVAQVAELQTALGGSEKLTALSCVDDRFARPPDVGLFASLLAKLATQPGGLGEERRVHVALPPSGDPKTRERFVDDRWRLVSEIESVLGHVVGAHGCAHDTSEVVAGESPKLVLTWASGTRVELLFDEQFAAMSVSAPRPRHGFGGKPGEQAKSVVEWDFGVEATTRLPYRLYVRREQTT